MLNITNDFFNFNFTASVQNLLSSGWNAITSTSKDHASYEAMITNMYSESAHQILIGSATHIMRTSLLVYAADYVSGNVIRFLSKDSESEESRTRKKDLFMLGLSVGLYGYGGALCFPMLFSRVARHVYNYYEAKNGFINPSVNSFFVTLITSASYLLAGGLNVPSATLALASAGLGILYKPFKSMYDSITGGISEFTGYKLTEYIEDAAVKRSQLKGVLQQSMVGVEVETCYKFVMKNKLQAIVEKHNLESKQKKGKHCEEMQISDELKSHIADVAWNKTKKYIQTKEMDPIYRQKVGIKGLSMYGLRFMFSTTTSAVSHLAMSLFYGAEKLTSPVFVYNLAGSLLMGVGLASYAYMLPSGTLGSVEGMNSIYMLPFAIAASLVSSWGARLFSHFKFGDSKSSYFSLGKQNIVEDVSRVLKPESQSKPTAKKDAKPSVHSQVAEELGVSVDGADQSGKFEYGSNDSKGSFKNRLFLAATYLFKGQRAAVGYSCAVDTVYKEILLQDAVCTKTKKSDTLTKNSHLLFDAVKQTTEDFITGVCDNFSEASTQDIHSGDAVLRMPKVSLEVLSGNHSTASSAAVQQQIVEAVKNKEDKEKKDTPVSSPAKELQTISTEVLLKDLQEAVVTQKDDPKTSFVAEDLENAEGESSNAGLDVEPSKQETQSSTTLTETESKPMSSSNKTKA